MLEGGLLVGKHGLDKILVSASILHLLGFTFSSLATNIWIIALSYGIIFGLACGIINSSVISTVIRHFRGAHGKASGIILMSFGLSPFVLTPIIGFINSILNWRCVLIVIGILGFTIIFSVATLLKSSRFN